MEYGAIDLHLKASQIRIVEADGVVMLDRRIATTRAALTQVFAGRARLRMLLESGTESEWVAQTLEACGHEVIVADPNYALMYGQRTRRIKTDKRDVAALAEACRLGIYRAAHRVSAAQREVRRTARAGAARADADAGDQSSAGAVRQDRRRRLRGRAAPRSAAGWMRRYCGGGADER